MCACPRDQVIETYVGVRITRERGVNVLVCWCLGERMTSLSLSVCVCSGGGLDFR